MLNNEYIVRRSSAAELIAIWVNARDTVKR
jgi:hypothetical protein